MSSGEIKELWRYPVCSIGGERVRSLNINTAGVDGDRAFVLVDLETGEVAAPEKFPRWRAALMLGACMESTVTLVSSSSWSMEVSDPRLDKAMTEHFGFPCGIRHVGATVETRGGNIAVEPRYQVSPLHILSLLSLQRLQRSLPTASIDMRRFRPTWVIDSTEAEDTWIGRTISSGAFKGIIQERTKRCGMTMVAQPGLPEEADILRTIIKTRGRCLGIYSTVTTSGIVALGDTISVT